MVECSAVCELSYAYSKSSNQVHVFILKNKEKSLGSSSANKCSWIKFVCIHVYDITYQYQLELIVPYVGCSHP